MAYVFVWLVDAQIMTADPCSARLTDDRISKRVTMDSAMAGLLTLPHFRDPWDHPVPKTVKLSITCRVEISRRGATSYAFPPPLPPWSKLAIPLVNLCTFSMTINWKEMVNLESEQ